MPDITAVQPECRRKRPVLRGHFPAQLNQRPTAVLPVQPVAFVLLALHFKNFVQLAVGLLLNQLSLRMFVFLAHQQEFVQQVLLPIADMMPDILIIIIHIFINPKKKLKKNLQRSLMAT